MRMRGMMAGGAVVVGICGGTVRAQTPIHGEIPAGTTIRNSAAPVAEPPASLADCLPKVDWDARERGPLLVVAPDKAVAWHYLRGLERPEDSKQLAAPGEPGPNGYRLATIVPYYQRKIAAVGSLSAVVPLRMVTLQYERLPEPDLSASIDGGGRTLILYASLKPAQWSRLLSQDGIGRADLDQKQQAIWDHLFGGGIQVYRMTPNPAGYASAENVPAPSPDSVRLRLYRRLAWRYYFKGEERAQFQLGVSRPLEKPSYSLQLNAPQERQFTPQGEGSAFGVNLLQARDNRSKPSDLAYDQPVLDRPVVLARAKKVGEMVKQVAEATGLELYADPRYRDLKIEVRVAAPTDAVRAGDLLKALAYSVTGTFRCLGEGGSSPYVLTDDRVGLGTRHAMISEWLREAEDIVNGAQNAAQSGLREARRRNAYLWQNNPDAAPSADLQKKLDTWEAARKPGENRWTSPELSVPVTNLPPDDQKTVRYALEYWAKEMAKPSDGVDRNRKPIQEDKVALDSTYVQALVVSEIGEVPISENMSPPPMSEEAGQFRSNLRRTPEDPTAVLPVKISSRKAPLRALTVAVHSADDAAHAAQLAQKQRLTHLFLPVPMGMGRNTVAEWVQAARGTAAGLKVYLYLRPLWQPAPPAGAETAGLPADRNLLGETWGQYRRRREREEGDAPAHTSEELVALVDPSVSGAVSEQVRALARIPGVDGIVLADTQPPGYALTDGRMPSSGGSAAELFGYTSGARLAFLRANGVDPVDLSPLYSFRPSGSILTRFNLMRLQLTPPFFPDYGPAMNATINGVKQSELGAKDSAARWSQFRYDAVTALRATVARAVGADRGGKTDLLIEQEEYWSPSFFRWSGEPAAPGAEKRPLPAYPAIQWERLPDETDAKPAEKLARQAALYFRGFLDATEKPTNRPVGVSSVRNTQASGFVLDLPDWSVKEAEELLSDITVVP